MSNTSSSSNNKTNLNMNMREFGCTSLMTDLRHMLTSSRSSFFLLLLSVFSTMQLVLHKITSILFTLYIYIYAM